MPTVTREDREAALDRVSQRMQFAPVVGRFLCEWVDTGRFRDGVHQMLAEELDDTARAFAAHREAAVMADRERTLEILRAEVLRIVRGEKP
jgi:hypothetical protein